MRILGTNLFGLFIKMYEKIEIKNNISLFSTLATYLYVFFHCVRKMLCNQFYIKLALQVKVEFHFWPDQKWVNMDR